MLENPHFNNPWSLATQNTDGDFFVTSLPATKTVNNADRSWFRTLLQNRSFTIGEYVVRNFEGKPVLPVAGPILDDVGNLVGILQANINLDALNISREQKKLPKGTTAIIFDQNGAILMRHPAGRFVGQTMPEAEIIRKAVSLKECVMEARGVEGKETLYAFRMLGQLGGAIYVAVGIPVEDAFAELRRIMITQFSLLANVTILAFFGARWLGNRYIESPIKRLLMITQRMADGDLGVRMGLVNYGNEINDLSAAFDLMADSLQARDAAIKKVLAENGHLIANLEGICSA